MNLFKIKGRKDVLPEKPMNKGIEKKGEGDGRKTFHSKELRIVKSYDDEQKSEYAFLTLTYEVL
ncbi:hypothetical protein M1B78_14560 [Bacteroides sp. KH569_7]|uniref:Uncharacterized protein n=1 Tax=Bacteroides muris (ex Fokt et al. 2023) TaxID=2937417 RepID=A0A9X2P238_9BACE|nr:hypothetical protein [Bacteroides muris (ex Fokt et al. 2023)]MCR6509349.1 hypothetical protein [Bacteroides muris (ex Fokt et al. 2023)]